MINQPSNQSVPESSSVEPPRDQPITYSRKQSSCSLFQPHTHGGEHGGPGKRNRSCLSQDAWPCPWSPRNSVQEESQTTGKRYNKSTSPANPQNTSSRAQQHADIHPEKNTPTCTTFLLPAKVVIKTLGTRTRPRSQADREGASFFWFSSPLQPRTIRCHGLLP